MKKILFISGTRADYGKMKSLMKALEAREDFEVYIFVCGMHLAEKFGSTYNEILKDGYKNVYVAFGVTPTSNLSANLGNTITNLAGYAKNIKPDMIVVHGDRMDALAGAAVGVINNIRVAHIEGGELSGTMDESIRHAISKFAHVHFVCSEEARNRLLQLGEEESRIYVIGSPDIDVMMSAELPDMETVKARYDLTYDEYAILMYHPVTTEYDTIHEKIKQVVDAVLKSEDNFVVIYPNNDLGSEIILNEYKRLQENGRFKVFPSLRFEYFLTLLKEAKYMIGNSSAGVRETGVYGIPAIDIGSRQTGRYGEKEGNIIHVSENCAEILSATKSVGDHRRSTFLFGDGNSTGRFVEIVSESGFWDLKLQKKFIDFDF